MADPKEIQIQMEAAVPAAVEETAAPRLGEVLARARREALRKVSPSTEPAVKPEAAQPGKEQKVEIIKMDVKVPLVSIQAPT
ncbi:MAG: hypothetical protein P4M11_12870 [Candidatus Pacebacteria bacterium]|nr:hypothetical protein [Candidatus Paceibacterota bacterium]